MIILILILSFFSFSHLEAKPFANNFVEMNIPDSWSCIPYAGDDWTCQPMDPTKVQDVLIVLSFANQGPKDSLQEFYKYLQESLMITEPATGKQHKSKPINMQYKDIMGQTWVDSQHMSVALPNYLTRYLATIKDGRALLLSLTVEKSKYNLYMSELYRTVESMRVRMTLPAEPLQTGLKGLLGSQKDLTKKLERKGGVAPEINVQTRSNVWLWAGLIAMAVFVLTFYIIKKRQKGKNKKRGFLK